MRPTDFANVARCADERMEQLWHDCCAASGNAWMPLHARRCREQESYAAMNNRCYTLWREFLQSTATK